VSPRGSSTRKCPTYGRSQHSKKMVTFPEFILYAGSALQSGLCGFFTSCMCQLPIPRIWRRALVVAIPKLNKPWGEQSLIALYLHCVSLSRSWRDSLIYTRVEPIINSLHLQDRWAFDMGGRLYIRSPCYRKTSRMAFCLRRPVLGLSISQQPATLYCIVASPARYCDCYLIGTWSA